MKIPARPLIESSRHRSAKGGGSPHKTNRLSVGIVLAKNFTLSSFALFTDLLRLAADEGDLSRQLRSSWTVMSHNATPTRASCGVTIARTSAFVDPKRFDYVMVAGGVLHGGKQIDDATADYLREAARRGVPLIGMCTGSFILARIGLMENRGACVSWYHHQDFIDEFPGHRVVADRIFLVDEDRITVPGGAGAADFALYLIDRHLGAGAAAKAQQLLQFERMRGGNEVPPHPPVNLAVSNPKVRRGLLLMEQNIANPLTIDEIASEVDLSVRQFERLFRRSLRQGPAAAYRAVRMRYARWLLAHSHQSVTDIALSAGFSDCAHFSRQFRDTFGIPPSKSRATAPGMADGERAASRIFE